MKDRSISVKITFWILFLIGLALLITAHLISTEASFVIFIYFIGIVCLVLSSAIANVLGWGNLEHPETLKLHHVFTVLESHEIQSNSEEKCFVVRLQNMRGEKLWFEFKDESPPECLKIVLDKNGKKTFEPFPPKKISTS